MIGSPWTRKEHPMSEHESPWAAELQKRDFDAWPEVSLDGTLPESALLSLPVFCRITMLSYRCTFAIDEQEVLWAAEGHVDLSDLGFTEIDFGEEEGAFPVLN
jgi:hypothetical protein